MEEGGKKRVKKVNQNDEIIDREIRTRAFLHRVEMQVLPYELVAHML